ncbi:MAG: amidase [Clostridiales bacterium]|nr:MAG: amidase [Clostridiales bacterium]
MIMQYDRLLAVQYAHKWAFHRNPNYADFEEMGGDCTNFVSQCVLAGGGRMDPRPIYGWYYYSLHDRAPAWSGVEAFYRFLTTPHKTGPTAVEIELEQAEPGDVVQLVTAGARFHHAAVIVETSPFPTLENTLVACHSFDSDFRALSTYNIRKLRFLHITAV